MALPAILTAVGIGSQAVGAGEARKATEAGAREALASSRKGREFAQELLDESIALQQPFIEAGQGALPLAELAARFEGDFRGTPAFAAREEQGMTALLNAIQGDELSGFASDRFGGRLDASEQGMNRARLNDLIAIGLGSSGSAGQQSGTLADLATRSAIQGGSLAGTGAQTAFEQRQNAINQAASEFSGLPAFLASLNTGGGGGNPFVTNRNPLGLTPGQGL